MATSLVGSVLVVVEPASANGRLIRDTGVGAGTGAATGIITGHPLSNSTNKVSL